MNSRLLIVIPGALALSICIAGVMPRSALSNSVSDFYTGKRVSVIISAGAGGGYDVNARLVTRHMARHIPGNPTMVPQNMPGAGHARAAQYMYAVAPQDGSTIATLGQNLPMAQMLQPEKTKFDMRKMNWIGNVTQVNNVTVAWHAAGIHKIDDLKTKELIVGTQGVNSTSAQYPLAMQNLLGLKFRVIKGFSGTKSIILALERGEVSGVGSNSWGTWKAQHPDWVREGKIKVLVQIGRKRANDLPDVPLLTELAPNAAARGVLALLSSGVVIGRPILTTPNVPEERVVALRKAFDATMKDAKYLAEAKKLKLDVSPIPGDELQTYVRELFSEISPDVINLTKAVLLGDGIADCEKIVADSSLCAKKKKKK